MTTVKYAPTEFESNIRQLGSRIDQLSPDFTKRRLVQLINVFSEFLALTDHIWLTFDVTSAISHLLS